MMKKVIMLIFVMLFSVSLVFAGFFTGALGWTGNVVLDCVDSDNGDYYVQGKTQFGNEFYVDECEENVLVEYSCGVGGIERERVECDTGCENGACSKNVATCNDGLKNGDEEGIDCGGSCPLCAGEVCDESDDAIDVMNLGVVETSFSRYEDECLDTYTLLEYYCSEGDVKKTEVECDGGCKEGKCLTNVKKCIESDNGLDMMNNGKVEMDVGVYEDECINEYTLVEYYCENDEIQKVNIACDEGCKEGKCLSGISVTLPKVESDITQSYLKRIFKTLNGIEEKLGYDSDGYDGDDIDESLSNIYVRLLKVKQKVSSVQDEPQEEICGVRALEMNENCDENNLVYVICTNGVEETREIDNCDNPEKWKLWAEDFCVKACKDEYEIDEDEEETDDCELTNIDFDEKCGGGYKSMKFVCSDGYSNKLESLSCQSENVWEESAKLECKKQCGNKEVCGDGICHPGESIIKCPADCLASQGLVVCGDGVCDASVENKKNCREDCGSSTEGVRARIKAWIQSLI